MSFDRFVRNLVVGFVVILASDYVWHTAIFGSFYTDKMGALVSAAGGDPQGPVMASIIVLELLIAAGAAWFVPRASKSKTQFILNGAFVGLLCSGSINLLNHAFFPAWDYTLVAVDTLWGVMTVGVAGGLMGLGKRK